MTVIPSQDQPEPFISHAEIIDAWPKPSLQRFAEDIGIPENTAKGMRRRNSIDQRYWVAVVSSAAARGIFGVTYERLAMIAAEKRPATEGAA